MKKVRHLFLLESFFLSLCFGMLVGCTIQKEYVDVSFQNYDQSILYSESIIKGSDATYKGETPQRNGDEKYRYIFSGWDKPLSNIVKDTVFIAQYRPEKITSKINIFYTSYNPITNGLIKEYRNELPDILTENACLEIEVDKNQQIELSVSPLPGVIFYGWFNNNHLLSKETDFILENAENFKEIEARFFFEKYELSITTSNVSFGSFTLNGIDSNSKKTIVKTTYFNEPITLLAHKNATVDCLGWFNKADNALITNSDHYSFEMPNNNLDLILKWNSFNIDYDLNGGTLDTPLIYDYSAGNDNIPLPEPIKTGYIFLGWYDTDQSVYINYVNTSELRDYNIRANWRPINYTIVYFSNAGDSETTISKEAQYDKQIQIMDCDFLNTGYSFIQWNTKRDGSGQSFNKLEHVENLTTIDGDIIRLYAIWEPIKSQITLIGATPFIVSFDTNGGRETIDPVIVDGQQLLQYPKIPTKNGYIFAGWCIDEECSTIYDFTTPIKDDLTLYAKWGPTGSYTVDMEKIRTTGSYTGTYLINKTVTISSLTSSYFRCGIKFASHIVPSSDSHYFVVSYTVRNITKGTLIKQGTVMDNRPASIEVYNLSPGDIVDVSFSKTNSYTNYPSMEISFSGFSRPKDGGSVDKSTHKTKIVAYNEQCNLMVPEGKNGLAFIGWFDENNQQIGNEQGIVEKPWTLLSDIELYGRWRKAE